MLGWPSRTLRTVNFRTFFLFSLLAVLLLVSGNVHAACVTSSCHDDIGQAKHVHDPVAGGECDSCHELTGEQHPGGDNPFTFPEVGSSLCLMCHDDPSAGQPHVHPALEDGCTSCHNPHAGPADKMLPAQGDALCYECHDDKTAGKAHVHSALEDGCTSCHDPHAGAAEKMLSASGEKLCYECHDSKVDGAVVHGPVEAGECTICHDPHASDSDYQLAEPGVDLCLMCHESKADAVRGEHVHPIVEDGCTNCHNPHNGPQQFMLPEEGDALCLMCHDDIQELMQSDYPHYGLDEGCTACHDAHGTGELRMFVVKADRLCYSCHDDKELEFAAYKSQHQPVANGTCWACHAPHGGDRPMLLKGNWPEKFYVPYSADAYSLCISCHGSKMFEYGRTSVETNFRNGDRNLHYLHVNKEKGRVCNVCHGVHGTNQEDLILDKVPGFGRWQIPIKHTVTETGGACLAGCHQPMYYDRQQRIVNR